MIQNNTTGIRPSIATGILPLKEANKGTLRKHCK